MSFVSQKIFARIILLIIVLIGIGVGKCLIVFYYCTCSVSFSWLLLKPSLRKCEHRLSWGKASVLLKKKFEKWEKGLSSNHKRISRIGYKESWNDFLQNASTDYVVICSLLITQPNN